MGDIGRAERQVLAALKRAKRDIAQMKPPAPIQRKRLPEGWGWIVAGGLDRGNGSNRGKTKGRGSEQGKTKRDFPVRIHFGS